jgi:hypothetical protein
MPTAAQNVNLVVGIEAPKNVGSNTRWISQAARHLQVPQTPYSRKPIIGSGVGQSATQEISPWWNPTTNRYECLVNVASAQYFSYADKATGPWSTPVKVLGQSTGGESGNAQQCSVLVEGTTLWAYYTTSQGSTTIQLAQATMPTTAGGTPSFTKLGTIWTSAAGTAESHWIIQTLGYYWLFAFSNARMLIARSTGASPADFLSTAPFSQVASAPLYGMSVNQGVRNGTRFGRPQVFREDGRWVLFGHLLDGISFQTCNVYRFVSDDAGIPLNWVQDSDKPFLDQRHPLEVDQIADFRLLRGPNDCAQMFWTAANNPGVAFSIMTASAREPMLASDGVDWYYTQQLDNQATKRLCFDSDAANADQTLSYFWDTPFRTEGANRKATLPVAASGARQKFRNSPANTTSSNQAYLAPANATDVILGGNPITAISAVGTTVTVTTKRPHNLAVGDLVTTTGHTPTGYNNTGVAITSVPAANQFVFTAGSSPAASSVIGSYVAALLPGEAQEWVCEVAGIWTRG